MVVSKINYCMCYEATVLSTLAIGASHMQLQEIYLNLMSPSLPNLLDLKLTKFMSCPSGEQSMLDYIGDILTGRTCT